MLRMGTYPQYLKERITSRTGHMNNIATAEFLAENITEDLKYIWLCHLSKDNNHPELAYKTVEWKLKSASFFLFAGAKVVLLFYSSKQNKIFFSMKAAFFNQWVQGSSP